MHYRESHLFTRLLYRYVCVHAMLICKYNYYYISTVLVRTSVYIDILFVSILFQSIRIRLHFLNFINKCLNKIIHCKSYVYSVEYDMVFPYFY